MVSDFRKKKLQHVFNVFFDVNKSGSIDRKDFEDTLQKAATIRGWKPTDPKYKEAETLLNKMADDFLLKVDKDKTGDVTFDEWVAAWDTLNPSAPQEWQTLWAKFIFELEDTSSDGSIDADEFTAVYTGFGLKEAEVRSSFQKMAKGKTSVSWAEFFDLWKEYFTTEDVNAPGNFIYGKASF